MNNDNLKKYLEEVKSKVDMTPKNVVAQTKLSKHKYSFSNLSFSEQLIIWDYIWNNSPDDWTRMQSLIFLESQIKDKIFLVDSWGIIKTWQKRVDNWGDCDALSRIFTKTRRITADTALRLSKYLEPQPNFGWDFRPIMIWKRSK